MSPEGIALVVTLVLAPTALLLVYRRIRGHRRRGSSDPFIAVSEPVPSMQRTPDELKAQVESDRFWVCATCRSLNLREASRCYSCRTAKGITGRQAPARLPVSRGYPVMADGIARSPVGLSVNRRVPVMAQDLAQSPGKTSRASVAVAAPRNSPPAHELKVRASQHPVSSSLLDVPEGLPVCPFIGWQDDPSTRYEFPDRANLCHVTSGPGTTSLASPRRFVRDMAGAGHPQPISEEHQQSCCLTAAHQQCARYPAVEVVPANR